MLIRFWFGQLHVGRTSGIAGYSFDASVTLCMGWRGDVPPEAPSWKRVWRFAWNWLPDRKHKSLRPTVLLAPTEGQMLQAAISGKEPSLAEVVDLRGVDSTLWTGRDRKFTGFGEWHRKLVSHRATRRSLMHVYLTGAKERASAKHVLFVQPAALVSGAECPEEWKNSDGTAKDYSVEFKYGRASVPDNLGRLLIKTGHARASNIVRVVNGSLLGSLASTIAGR